MSGQAGRPVAPWAPRPNGGCTFAEYPDRDSRSARIIWHADLDPGTLIVDALPASPADPTALLLSQIAPWLTVVKGDSAGEHAVLSDGRQRIRLDLVSGHLAGLEAVDLRVRFDGIDRARYGILPLQRLLALARNGRFAASLSPREPAVTRGITVLRVHDGLSQGASLREIAEVLFGPERVGQDEARGSDSLRSRVRRLVREARSLAGGGYRSLMRK